MVRRTVRLRVRRTPPGGMVLYVDDAAVEAVRALVGFLQPSLAGLPTAEDDFVYLAPVAPTPGRTTL